MAEQYPFKWRHFEAEIILLCVRWYLRSALSYRDLALRGFQAIARPGTKEREQRHSMTLL